MIKFGFLFSAFLLFSVSLFAIIAYPYKVQVKAAGGYASLTLQGNECVKYAITENGFCVVQDSLGWRYLQCTEDNNVGISDYYLVSDTCPPVSLQTFLESGRAVRQWQMSKFLAKQSRRARHETKRSHRQDKPVIGYRKVLIVMMQFTDCTFKKTQTDFNALFNESGYSVDGAIGSVYDYYQFASYEQLNLHCDVIGPYTAAHDMAYYGKNVGMGGNDKNPYALFSEALQFASYDVNLSEYDADGDGVIDNFHIIYAGYGEEAGAAHDAIWAHESTFAPISISGMQIDRYSCAPELRSNNGNGISRIGPHCHEIGHALGAMDYYDTDYTEGGYYSGTGKWDVMSSGSWNNEGISPANFNPYVKAYDFGWMKVETLKRDSTILMLPSARSNVVYRVNTPVNNDFFLLENRQQELFDHALPGKGLLLYHIGSNIENKLESNAVNSTFPQNCYVVCASATATRPTSTPASYGNIDSGGCPFPGTTGKTSFSPVTVPAALCVNGSSANFEINSIHEEQSGVALHFVAGNSMEDSTNEETNIPLDGEIVWAEDFKGWTIPTGWTQECLIGNCQWTIGMTGKGNIMHFAELTYEALPWAPNKLVSTSLKTSTIDLEAMDYVLSFDMVSLSTNDVPDTLKVTNSWGIPLCQNIVVAASNSDWQSVCFIIKAEMFPCELVFTGIVKPSSVVRLANLKLRKLTKSDAIIENKLALKGKPIPIRYNIGGRHTFFNRGLNIINNGTTKKIYVK